jgi:hypothetical protein
MSDSFRRTSLFAGSLIFISVLFLVIPTVNAAVAAPDLIVPIPIVGGGQMTEIPSNPASYIKTIYQWGIGLAALLAMGQLVLGGVQYVISAGMPSAKSSAEERMTSAVTGLVILLCIVVILTTINPSLANISLPSIPKLELQGEGPSLDNLISASRKRVIDFKASDLQKVGNVPDKTAAAATKAAAEGTPESAQEARDADAGLHGTTQTAAQMNPFYRAVDELKSAGGLKFCGDTLQKLQSETLEYVNDPDMDELIGPDGLMTGNGDFAEPLEDAYNAEALLDTAKDVELADARATIRCKRAAVLLGVEYVRKLFIEKPSVFAEFTKELRALGANKYHIDLYYKDSSKLFEGI